MKATLNALAELYPTRCATSDTLPASSSNKCLAIAMRQASKYSMGGMPTARMPSHCRVDPRYFLPFLGIGVRADD